MAAQASGGPGVGGACAQADELRTSGNDHFRAGRLSEAAQCYREALAALPPDGLDVGRDGEAGKAVLSLGQAARLNLAACLLESEPEEALRLCDDVLQREPENAKALFRRASARQNLAARISKDDPSAQREELAAARRDLVQAARLEPKDWQVRGQLEQVTEALKGLERGEGLRLGLGSGLYSDREVQAAPQEPPVVPAVPEVRGREYWLQLRADWLQVPVEEVDREPDSFEDDGPLREVILADRRARVAADPDPSGLRPGLLDFDADGNLPELSDDEREMLEDCLDATVRPFPQPLRPLSLAQAVRCAEEFWDQ